MRLRGRVQNWETGSELKVINFEITNLFVISLSATSLGLPIFRRALSTTGLYRLCVTPEKPSCLAACQSSSRLGGRFEDGQFAALSYNFGRPSDGPLSTFEAPSARPGATSRLEFRTRSEEMDKLKEAHELLQRLRDQHPKDTEEELSRRFAAAVRGDSMMFRAVIKDTLGDLLREPQRKRKDN
jgi:hypothetical protein